MEMNFCRRCGTKLSLVNGHVHTCENDHVIFANASPSSALWIINDKNEVLVTIRSRDPHKGMLDAAGGFSDGAETLEACLAREMEEELGLKPTDYTTPEYLLSDMDKYEYKGETFDSLCGVFYARIIGNPVINPQDDVAEARFVPLADVDANKICFKSVREAFIKLRSTVVENK